MSAAVLLDACTRIDAAAAALRVLLVSCSPNAAETTRDNVAGRQVALRAIVAVIEQGRQVLQNTPGGDPFDPLALLFFVELVSQAEQALWAVLEDGTLQAPSNADLCALLRLALQVHADSVAERPKVPPAAVLIAARLTKGGAA